MSNHPKIYRNCWFTENFLTRKLGEKYCLHSVWRYYRRFLFSGTITAFQFIITFVLTVKIFTLLRGITEKIQGRSLDLYDVVNQVNLKVVTTWSISGNCLNKARKKYSTDYNGILPRNIFIQKKSLKGNVIKFFLKIYNFIEVTLRCGCSPVNLMRTFRSPFYSNTSGGLFLFILLHVGEGC